MTSPRRDSFPCSWLARRVSPWPRTVRTAVSTGEPMAMSRTAQIGRDDTQSNLGHNPPAGGQFARTAASGASRPATVAG